MNKRRLLILILFVLTIVTGISAVWIGIRLNNQSNITPDDTEAGVPPAECKNPVNDAPNNSLLYCPGNGGKFNTGVVGKGLHFRYQFGTTPVNVQVFVNNTLVINQTVSCPQNDCTSEISNANITLTATDEIKVAMINVGDGQYMKGWRGPSGTLCGEAPFGTKDIGPLLGTVGTGEKILSVQCWADSPIQDADYDFNDRLAVVTMDLLADTSTPTPTPTKSATPTPSKTVTPTPTPSKTPTPSLTPTGTLPPSPTPSKTPTPTPTKTPTPTPSNTPTGTVPPTFTPTVTPTTAPGNVTVDKTSTDLCLADASQSTVDFTIVISNPNQTSVTVNITDSYNASLNSYLQTNSITPTPAQSGNGSIVWNNLVIPASGSITLNYQMVIPQAAFGTYTNTVQVRNLLGTLIGSDQLVTVVDCLPPTALISDEVDRVLLGFLLVVVGVLVYKYGLYQYFGQAFWHLGGKYVLSKVHDDYAGELNQEIKNKHKGKIKDMRQDFESKMKDRLDD